MAWGCLAFGGMMGAAGDTGEDNHANPAGEMAKPGLLELKTLLRTLPNAGRRDLRIGPPELASGSRALLSAAPRRALPYFSRTRGGMAPAEPTVRRKEERLAMAWFNTGALRIEGGGEFALLDYQFPLKSAMADQGTGKIDLLGFCAADGALAVIELKIGSNAEDRRIGLLEGLIYAAIVEANAAAIISQLEKLKGHRVKQPRPIILLAFAKTNWLPLQRRQQATATIRILRKSGSSWVRRKKPLRRAT